jgi:hypothetical protein
VAVRHPASLGDLISEALAGAEPLARVRGVELRGYAAASPPVYVDAAKVGRALCHLMINAIGHTSADGSVEVLGGEESGMAVVSVSDSCGGIPAGLLARPEPRTQAAHRPGIVEAHAARSGSATPASAASSSSGFRWYPGAASTAGSGQ